MGDRAIIEATIDRYFRGFPDRDRETYLSVFAPEGNLQDPPTEGKITASGLDEIGAFFTSVLRWSTSMSYERHGTWICDQEAAVHSTARITGESFVLDVPLVHVFEFDDEGLVRNLKAFWTRESVRLVKGESPLLLDGRPLRTEENLLPLGE